VDNRVTYGAVKDSRDKLVVGRIRKVQADLGRDLRDADVLFDFDRERKAQDDVFYDISIVKGNAAENLPFDTQKPVKLVARLIDALCPPDGVVADLFAGSGTTAAAAEAAGRRWVVADAGPPAVMMTRKRLVTAGGTPFVRQRIAAVDQHLGRLVASARSDGAAVVVTLTGCDGAVGDITGLDARGLEAVTALAARDPLALLDGWAVDAAYDGAVFRPQWQTYRGMGDSGPLRVVTTARLDRLPDGGSPQGVCVRAIDVFGRELEVVVPLRS
jgi:adenine-specific DNA-methyltransferase